MVWGVGGVGEAAAKRGRRRAAKMESFIVAVMGR